MRLERTAEAVRKIAPRRRMDTFWHWVFAFCFGFALAVAFHEDEPCDAEYHTVCE